MAEKDCRWEKKVKAQKQTQKRSKWQIYCEQKGMFELRHKQGSKLYQKEKKRRQSGIRQTLRRRGLNLKPKPIIDNRMVRYHPRLANKEWDDDQEVDGRYHQYLASRKKQWTFDPLQETIKIIQQDYLEPITIADLGCGFAELAQELGNFHTVISVDKVALADCVLEGDMRHLDMIPDHSVDLVVCCLSLTGDITRKLKEVKRILKSGGRLIAWGLGPQKLEQYLADYQFTQEAYRVFVKYDLKI